MGDLHDVWGTVSATLVLRDALAHARAPQDEGGVREESRVADLTHMDSRDFDELEGRAREILTPGAFAFAAGGADDEVTLDDNIAAWQRLRLRPRMLRDVTNIDTSTTVLGARIAAPLMVAPTGRHRLFHPDGEHATARGAAAAGVPYVMATAATVSM